MSVNSIFVRVIAYSPVQTRYICLTTMSSENHSPPPHSCEINEFSSPIIPILEFHEKYTTQHPFSSCAKFEVDPSYTREVTVKKQFCLPQPPPWGCMKNDL